MRKIIQKATARGQRGFTLIELLAVMAIIAILAAIVAPNVTGSKDASVAAQVQGDAQQVTTAASDFFSDQNASEFRTPHSVTTTTLLGGTETSEGSVASGAQQIVSSRWPEIFITEQSGAPDLDGDTTTSSSEYSAVFETTAAKVREVIVLDKDGTAISGSDLLEGFTAIDMQTLEDAGGFDVPQGVGLTSNGSPNFLWLFEKTTVENTDDSRVVAVFQLVKSETLETIVDTDAYGAFDGSAVRLTYQRIQ